MVSIRFLLLFITSHFFLNGYAQNCDSVEYWNVNQKLKWSDFRGKPADDKAHAFLKATSSIVIEPVAIVKDNSISYKVIVTFEKYLSWKRDTSSKLLLAHEQLHFDIGEWYARRLRKQIDDLSKAIGGYEQKEYDILFDKFFEDYKQVHIRYDKETAHGIIRDAQINWEKKVSVELNLLGKHASTNFKCPK